MSTICRYLAVGKPDLHAVHSRGTGPRGNVNPYTGKHGTR
jgi:hypothetical protein